jgi:hypothetical protein
LLDKAEKSLVYFLYNVEFRAGLVEADFNVYENALASAEGKVFNGNVFVHSSIPIVLPTPPPITL